MSFNTFYVHGLLHAAGSVIEPATRAVAQIANCALPNEIPNTETLIDLALKGWINKHELAVYCCMNGVPLDPLNEFNLVQNVAVSDATKNIWAKVFYATQELPGLHETLTLANRGRISDAQLDLALRRLGYYNETVRGDLANLRYEIPGSSDLVRFSVRHVFEPDLIERLGYNDEFRPILDFWHRLQGLNYPLFSGPFAKQIGEFEQQRGLEPGSFLRSYEDVGLQDPTWAQAFWWAHWINASPSQAYEAYFRLRPDRDRSFDPPFARGIDFTIDDLNLNLRANDYPPKLRPILAAIAHRVPGIRFLRQLRATEVFTQKDVKELLLRQGYSDGDATVLAESVERNDRDVRRRGIEQQAKGQLARYWELGAIDSAQYRTLLEQHGLTPAQADETIALADLDLKYKRLTKIVDFVRRQFIKGILDANQAANQLRQAGVVNDRVPIYIEDWQLEIQTKHREVSAQKAVQWACKGLITLADLQARLGNLGYLPADIAGLVAEAQICQATLATRAANQQARQQAASARQLQQIQRAAAQAIVNARRQLAAHGSPAQLRKWFCQGHLSQSDLYSRLRFLGWPDEDITRLISDCKTASGGKPGG
jgi:hypothetical protein